MDQAAINALYARAEIFNRLEEAKSQLNEEEAGYAATYMENLIKTRPIRRPESGQFEPGLHNMNFREPGLHAPEIADTNCEFCAAGNPRYKTHLGVWYHEINTAGATINLKSCEAAHA